MTGSITAETPHFSKKPKGGTVKKNLLHVSVGDVVEVTFNHGANRDPRRAKILKITRRYGRHNDGRDQMSPLIEVTWLDPERKNGHSTFDQSFITKMVERTKVSPAAYNMYRDAQKSRESPVIMGGSEWSGSIDSLAALSLSKLPNHIIVERPIDFNKVMLLYKKNPMGLLRGNGCWFVVNHKRFSKWVFKNYTKFLRTVKEIDAEMTQRNRDNEADYAIDMAAELNEELYEDLDRDDAGDNTFFDEF